MRLETIAIFRYILTITLLGIVWEHSHWSVAFSLSLIFVYIELKEFIALMVKKRIDKLQGIVQQKPHLSNDWRDWWSGGK